MSTSYQKDNGDADFVPINGNGHSAPRSNMKKWIFGGVAAIVVALVAVAIFHKPAGKSTKDAMAKADLPVSEDGTLMLFDDLKRFLLEDYDAKSNFASFLPGVGGYFGKPVWAFYVNRGQVISTFGTESKDYPLLEFNPANKAYQLTPYIGFRTFVRGTRKGATSALPGSSFQVEPFSAGSTRNLLDPKDDPDKPKRILYVGTNEVEIQEIDGVNDLTTAVKYFILPEEDFAALIRRTTFTNTGNAEIQLEILDGLAKIEPSGGPLDGMLKSMGRTLEGWFGVYHADDTLNMPFFKMSTEPSDQAKVTIEEKGHYCLSFIESANETAALLPIVFDKDKVFGKSTSLENPDGLLASSVGDILDSTQYGDAKTSSSFAAIRSITLKPGQNFTVASVYGRADHIDEVPGIAKIVTAPGFVAKKFARARTMISELTMGVETNTTNPLFDSTVKQMFLDNSLRGGIPTILGNVDADTTYDEDPSVKVYHAFSRIHGDLERDYNAFKIDPTYFSQGPGNYRDVAQNRRNDVTFFPRMGSFDIKQFLSFIQADGYEPLTVEAQIFAYEEPDKADEIAKKVTTDEKSAQVLGNVLKGGPFRPGQLFELCDQLHINRTDDNEEFINTILASAKDHAMAVYGTGYWADHWDYYIDLIEAYLAIFPDGEETLMYDNELAYFFSTATVRPRAEKYVLDYTFDGTSKHVIQLDATYFDQGKAQEQEDFRNSKTGLLGIEASWQRTKDGKTFKSTPIAKLFLLAAIKFAMRDAWGMGIEYEGGRPGWLDSMNGLPGMVGSGMPETYELLLLMKYVKKVVDSYDRDIVVPAELGDMIDTVEAALDDLVAASYKDEFPLPRDVPDTLFKYWNITATARETYRSEVEYYFSGETTIYTAKTISKILKRWIKEVELGIERANSFGTIGHGDDGTSGVPACFFSYDVTEWEDTGKTNDHGLPLVNAKAMKVGTFPMFLEGPVRYMKTIQDDKEKMEDMYERVLASGLRDHGLKMYYLSASLEGQTYDMGRQIAFAPGWLENQSIWMHMSYKYYLQLLRGKLYEQFFAEYREGGILPFMNATTYGRPLTECSSFIASSAFPDPSIHGMGFLARLSGSTAEFMDIYKLMFLGPTPFFLNKDGEVEFQVTPALPSWLFVDETADGKAMYDEDGQAIVSFKLFGQIPVTYHNPDASDLYGVSPKKYVITMRDGSVETVEDSAVPNKLAVKIRRTTKVASIDAFF
ncbi:4-alpha-glucanotransferase [Nitzschia inconspicua]|uniref:4-alpha-glucanotransferase n=1 Tax=Nitzschia inconspicua TaxID=303405 RepID=A0A9K3LE37_9STRA|nr:4-alpha-glucanotransferase [Nitzschia inconspicua]